MGEVPIQLTYTHDYKRITIPCGVTVQPSFFKNGRVSRSDALSRLKNVRITRVIDILNRVLIKLELANQKPKVAIVKDLCLQEIYTSIKTLNPRQKAVKKAKNTFLGDFKKFIDLSEKGKRKTANQSAISENTLKSYKSTLKHLLNFNKHKSYELSYAKIDEDFYYEFVEFLRYLPEEYRRQKNKKVMLDNSIDKYIKDLKSFMSYGLERDWHNISDFENILIRIGYDPVPYALPQKNLQQLIELDDYPDEKLQKARDLFLLGVIGCMRISDQMCLTREDNLIEGDGESLLYFIPNKTNSSSGKRVSIIHSRIWR